MAELVWNGKQHNQPSLSASEEKHIQTDSSGLVVKEEYRGENSLQQTSSWFNRLIYGDNQEVLPALLAEFTDAVDLISIDPPFMTGRTFKSGEQIAYHDTWNNDLDSYLHWLHGHLQLLYRLLAPDGSLYIHLDWRAVHYARVLLDEIFGGSYHGNGPGFKNEIIWQYQTGGRARKFYPRKHDTILWYTKSSDYCFHPERIGERRGAHKRNHMRKELEPDGRVSWTIRSGGRVYRYTEDTLISLSDVWNDISHLHQKDPERVGYATQKPEALLERILQASSEENDLVLDCFCGSGVMPVVAQRLHRRWIAIDKSELAIAKTRQRLLDQGLESAFVLQQSSHSEEKRSEQDML